MEIGYTIKMSVQKVYTVSNHHWTDQTNVTDYNPIKGEGN